MKENYQITAQDGKQYWISRSVAVAVIIVVEDYLGMGEDYYLIHRRGVGCPDYQGYWSINCGYIGWDETIKQAAVREVYEETGLKIPEDSLKYFGYSDPIDNDKQNVTIRFSCRVSWREMLLNLDMNTASRGGEKDEIDKFRIIPIKYVKDLEWAFDHDKLLLEFSKKNKKSIVRRILNFFTK